MCSLPMGRFVFRMPSIFLTPKGLKRPKLIRIRFAGSYLRAGLLSNMASNGIGGARSWE